MNQLIQHTIRSVSLILTVLAALTLAACGNNGDSSGNDNSNPARNYIGTQAPGDLWTWTITTSGGTGTFTASNDTLGYTYSGDIENLTNGFLKLTITATTEPGLTLTPPVIAYALEFPDTALVIKPAGTTGNVIVAAALGSCPTADATYNWVALLDSNWNSATAAYGVSESSVTGSNFDFSHMQYDINGTFLEAELSAGYTCSRGRITHSTYPIDPTVIVVTPSGVFIADSGPGAGGIVGMQAPASDIDWSDVVLAGREYRGVIFEDGSAGDDTRPIWVRPNGSGGLTGGEWDDFLMNVENTTDTTTVTFGVQASPGVVNATLTDTGDITVADMVLMINKINGKYFIYGAQINTASGKGSNFLVIEQ